MCDHGVTVPASWCVVCGPHQQRDPANITTKTILQNRIPPPLIKIVVLIICAGEGEGGQFISLWCLKYYWTLDLDSSVAVCVPPSSDLRPGRCCVSKYVQNDKHVFIRRRVVEKWRMRAKYKASS